MDWKLISRNLCDQHNAIGSAAVSGDGSDVSAGAPDEVVPTVADEQLLEVPGPTLTPKRVRGWLWHLRHHRATQRPRVLFFSWFDGSTSRVGVAAATWAADRWRATHG